MTRPAWAKAVAWDDLATALEERTAALAIDCWQGLRAVELMWDELSEEFDGEDIVRSFWRELVSECKERLAKLAQALAPSDEEIDLPEPTEDQVELRRAFVARMRAAR